LTGYSPLGGGGLRLRDNQRIVRGRVWGDNCGISRECCEGGQGGKRYQAGGGDKEERLSPDNQMQPEPPVLYICVYVYIIIC
jgi:hypothetical protein